MPDALAMKRLLQTCRLCSLQPARSNSDLHRWAPVGRETRSTWIAARSRHSPSWSSAARSALPCVTASLNCRYLQRHQCRRLLILNSKQRWVPCQRMRPAAPLA